MGFFIYNHMEITELYQLFKEYPNICTDTRSIQPHSLFFALKGENFNGNQFAEKALQNGAAFGIIDEPKFLTNDNLILVDDVLTTLQNLAKFHRSQLTIPVIGITGSNGKTTTKELTHSVLTQKYNCFATKGNLNNHIGVPLSLLSINSSHEIAIIEMGANHVGEIKDLCAISQPTIGLITNIGKAHLEGFGGFEGVKVAKSELYKYLEQKDNPVFINGDNKILEELSDGLFKISYGQEEQNHIIGKTDNKKEQLSIAWKKRGYFGYSQEIKTHLVGHYNLENVLAAICIGNHFEVSEEQIATGIESYLPSNNRSQLIKKGTNHIILDAYNANPVSLKAAIENVLNSNHATKYIIAGDMKELGQYSEPEHQSIVDLIVDHKLNAFLVGPEFQKTNYGNIKTFKDTLSLSNYIKDNPISDAIILIKGSRSIGLEQTLDVL